MEGGGWGLEPPPQVLEGNFFLAVRSRLSFNEVSGGSEAVFLIGGEQLVTALALQMGSHRC